MALKHSLIFARPLLPLALAAIAGICVAFVVGQLTLSLCLCLLVCLLFFLTVRLQPNWLMWFLPLLFLLGTWRTGLMLERAMKLVAAADGQSRILTGTVAEVPKTGEYFDQAVVRRPDGTRVLLSYPRKGTGLSYGERIKVTVCYELPRGQRNPGGFDETAWLKSRGILVKAKPIGKSSVSIAGHAPLWTKPVVLGQAARKTLIDLIDQLLPDQQADVLCAVLLGEKQGLSQQVQSDFRRSGLAHLTSVSGMHVSLLLLPAGRLLRHGGLGRRKRLVLLLIILIGYGFLTGWHTAVSRAILMSGCALSGRLLHRPRDAASSLALAVILIFGVQPFAIWGEGFWLSFLATAALVALAEPMQNRLKESFPFLPAFLLTPLASGLSIQICLLPLLAIINQQVSLAGLVSNPPAALITTAICYLAIIVLPIGGLLLPIFPALGHVLALPLGFFSDLLGNLAGFMGRKVILRAPNELINPVFWMIWLLFAGALICRLRFIDLLRRRRFRSFKRIRVPLIVIWLLIAVLNWYRAPLVQVWFFDVGQGDAILLKSRFGETILVDGGKFGQGWQVILPALDYLGIDQIDVLIATHGHDDHIGGLIDVIKSGRGRNLLVSGRELAAMPDRNKSQSGDRLGILMEAASLHQIPVSELIGNDTIALGTLIELQVLDQHEPKRTIKPDYDSNDYSLVLHADLAGFSLLLTGDCTADAENNLIRSGLLGLADVLKVAHHGSKYATTTAMLEQVRPRAAVISVGPNFYGHPSKDTLQRLSEHDCRVWRTDQQGAIHLSINKAGWVLHPACP
ncbi:MAG: DNA internalization-related competence protein ComEC/Rec2 [Clostridiaceae bacterium]|nr:DNA internalization-related competence protein ComEC/Rec2 [Clostridiaceae bacterium]